MVSTDGVNLSAPQTRSGHTIDSKGLILKVITGTWVYSDGTPVAGGRLFFKLSQDAAALGTSQIAPQLISFTLDNTGSIPANSKIYFNDELTPVGTTYTVSVVEHGGGLVWGAESVSIVGTSFNLNNAQPTTQNVMLANVVLTNPSSAQTITGFDLNLVGGNLNVTGNETVSGTVTSGAAHVTGNQTVDGTLGVTGLSTLKATTIKSLNGLTTVFADQYTDIQTAVNALPSAGGIVDARSPNVNLTMGAIDAGSNSKPVTLLLGPFTYTFTQITVRQGFNILGAGLINTTLSNVGTNANPAFVIPQVNNNAIIFHWADFQVLGLTGNTSQDGIFFDASTLTNAGVELSTFTNLQFTGFKGVGIHLKATQDGVSGSIGAIQGLSFFNVTSIRPTGATGASQNSLRIEGGCGQIGFWDCWFTGASSDTGTNVFTGTTGTQAPYSIHHHITTNQNGFAYLFDGATGCTTEKDHFENIKGCYSFANTASPIVGFRSESAFINSNVAVNAGNGYIVNVPAGTPSVDVLIESPMIGGQPDNGIKSLTNGTNVRILNAQILPSNTPVNVISSTGVTFQGTPAATLDIKCCKSIQLSASATSITTLKSGLQPGEFVTFYPTGGTAQFATGGNLSFGSFPSPLILASGDSATFVRVDAGTPAFVLQSITKLGRPAFQLFSGSGTFTIPAGMTVVKATVLGGGGAGGGATATNNGGGGGSGAVAIKYLTGLTPGNTIIVTVGAGGTGVSAAAGGAGVASNIASGTQTITTVTAGGGGGGNANGVTSAGGTAGTLSTNGDINNTGTPGAGTWSTISGAAGASSMFGGGGNDSNGGNPGNAAGSFGGGGGGAGAGANRIGGNGAGGFVLFEWTN